MQTSDTWPRAYLPGLGTAASGAVAPPVTSAPDAGVEDVDECRWVRTPHRAAELDRRPHQARATAHDATASLSRRRQVPQRVLSIHAGLIPIATPLFHVACHLNEAVGRTALDEGIDRCGRLGRRAALVPAEDIGAPVIAPGEDTAIRSPSRSFPFDLGRQSQARPAAVRRRSEPGNVDRRVPLEARGGLIATSCATMHDDPLQPLNPGTHLFGRRPNGREESCELRVRDREDADREPWSPCLELRTLVQQRESPAVLVHPNGSCDLFLRRAHDERPSRDHSHEGTVARIRPRLGKRHGREYSAESQMNRFGCARSTPGVRT
jgi:hypothetical protein